MMQIAGFEFAEGARFQPGAKADAGEVGTYIELLRKEKKGELTPEDVVTAARNKNSPLHSYFEWDDGKAAEAHRLSQARGLIRAVVAIYTHDDKPVTKARAYVHIAEKGAPHYRELGHAMSQKATRQLVLQRAWRELVQFRNKYQGLKEFAAVFEAADVVMKRLPAAVRKAGG